MGILITADLNPESVFQTLALSAPSLAADLSPISGPPLFARGFYVACSASSLASFPSLKFPPTLCTGVICYIAGPNAVVAH